MMIESRRWPRLIILAGSSEAGKSTAGQFLESLGVRRIKIRTILKRLDSGSRIFHEGIETRENFDPGEFIQVAISKVCDEEKEAVVIESFIDAELANSLKLAWPGICKILFVTAPRKVRAGRLSDLMGMTVVDACAAIDLKDSRKRVAQQLALWREVSDFFLDNHGNLSTYKAQLTAILTTVLTEEE